ncbi:hypothetical protein GPJ56_008611 [Histomonas meleagridis]|uniref:uncharacterized protein n=1 Tax=Histomonas meleagridis TaxID=135588 RepID=UPI0035595622|nr:hypothetical protein GPJ56_008611 [Histomonas meleagridis]KAH0805812.1 hypothetical protein GO595_001451 [Histomonas meleagridis]
MSFSSILTERLKNRNFISVSLDYEVLQLFCEDICSKLDELDEKILILEKAQTSKENFEETQHITAEKQSNEYESRISSLENNNKELTEQLNSLKQEIQNMLKDNNEKIDASIGKCIIDTGNITRNLIQESAPEVANNAMKLIPNLDSLIRDNIEKQKQIDSLNSTLNEMKNEINQLKQHKQSNVSSFSTPRQHSNESSIILQQPQQPETDEIPSQNNVSLETNQETEQNNIDYPSNDSSININKFKEELSYMQSNMEQDIEPIRGDIECLQSLIRDVEDNHIEDIAQLKARIEGLESAVQKPLDISAITKSNGDIDIAPILQQLQHQKSLIQSNSERISTIEEKLKTKISEIQQQNSNINDNIFDIPNKEMIPEKSQTFNTQQNSNINSFDHNKPKPNIPPHNKLKITHMNDQRFDSLNQSVRVLEKEMKEVKNALHSLNYEMPTPQETNTNDNNTKIQNIETPKIRSLNSGEDDNSNNNEFTIKTRSEPNKIAKANNETIISERRNNENSTNTNNEENPNQNPNEIYSLTTSNNTNEEIHSNARSNSKSNRTYSPNINTEEVTYKVSRKEFHEVPQLHNYSEIRSELNQIWSKLKELTELENEDINNNNNSFKDTNDFIPKTTDLTSHANTTTPKVIHTIFEKTILPKISAKQQTQTQKNNANSQIEDIKLSNTFDKVDKQENLLYQLKRAVEIQQRNILQLDEAKVDKNSAQALFEQFRIALSELNSRLNTIKKALIGKVNAADLNTYFGNLMGEFNNDETSTGTENIRCLCCGRPRRNIKGAIDDPSMVNKIAGPVSTRVLGDGEGQVCFVYGERGDMYIGRSGNGKSIFSKAPSVNSSPKRKSRETPKSLEPLSK